MYNNCTDGNGICTCKDGSSGDKCDTCNEGYFKNPTECQGKLFYCNFITIFKTCQFLQHATALWKIPCTTTALTPTDFALARMDLVETNVTLAMRDTSRIQRSARVSCFIVISSQSLKHANFYSMQLRCGKFHVQQLH